MAARGGVHIHVGAVAAVGRWLFFRCCGAPSGVSSFPTRRSSDLLAQARVGAGLRHRHRAGLRDDRRHRLRGALGLRRHRHGYQPGRDRKSTRLNSSHSSISYAVFCLKKKNGRSRRRSHSRRRCRGGRALVVFSVLRGAQRCELFPYTTLFRSTGSSAGGSWTSASASRRATRRSAPSASRGAGTTAPSARLPTWPRSEEHTSELQSQFHLVCRLLLEKKKWPLAAAFTFTSALSRRSGAGCFFGAAGRPAV